jgi:hypothetical protein
MERHARRRTFGAERAPRSDPGRPQRLLRPVPPSALERPRVPRPRWMLLYLGVCLAAAIGLGLSVAAEPGFWRTLAGAVTMVALFGTMIMWTRMNRVALTEWDGRPRPDGWPLVDRVILSSRRHGRTSRKADAGRGTVVRLAPGEDGALTYDFD